jgi:hypothetical protein
MHCCRACTLVLYLDPCGHVNSTPPCPSSPRVTSMKRVWSGWRRAARAARKRSFLTRTVARPSSSSATLSASLAGLVLIALNFLVASLGPPLCCFHHRMIQRCCNTSCEAATQSHCGEWQPTAASFFRWWGTLVTLPHPLPSLFRDPGQHGPGSAGKRRYGAAAAGHQH